MRPKPQKAAFSPGPIRYGSPIEVGDELSLDGAAMKGLAFREVNVKEAFTLVDATGAWFRASLKSAEGERGMAVAYERLKHSPESPASLTLVCAVLSRQRMIFVVQKATELGVTRIVPVLTAHSVQPKDLEHEKPWAWPGQAIKGVRQCRRGMVPEVLGAQPLAHALSAPWWKSADNRFVLDDRVEGGTDPLTVARPSGSYVLAVGPEGGWSDKELAALTAAGAQPLVLGSRVLRAETAVLAGLSVLQHRLGDLHP